VTQTVLGELRLVITQLEQEVRMRAEAPVDAEGNYIHDSLDNGVGVIYIPPSNRR
jgi:hypothetical protein